MVTIAEARKRMEEETILCAKMGQECDLARISAIKAECLESYADFMKDVEGSIEHRWNVLICSTV